MVDGEGADGDVAYGGDVCGGVSGGDLVDIAGGADGGEFLAVVSEAEAGIGGEGLSEPFDHVCGALRAVDGQG